MYRLKTPMTGPGCGGFTLVELLIVVIILALLSAIILPQFSDSMNDSKLTVLKGNLAVMRNAIERYKTEHRRWPGKLTSMGGTCANGGSAGSGLVNSSRALADQLSFYTDPNGRSCSTRDSTFTFGPYLKDQQIPTNPFSGSNKVIISTSGELGLKSARVDGKGGWIYDVWTGEIIADDAAYDDI